ncbi:hypothetical protein TWF696_008833 [Orbilia brochopaga]|uniref:Uncharacterized protein n=1 Tax=Orbilia brochopaga TaxID=3140254 RepID=A0AAV9UGX5_9PEZI
MSRRPPPQDHAASSSDIPTLYASPTSSPVYTDHNNNNNNRPPPVNRTASEPFGGYDVPASSTISNKPLRSILTNPIPPPATPRVRFLIPQSSTEIRDRLAGGGGLVDSPASTTSSNSRDRGSDSEDEEDSPRRPRRSVGPEPRDLSDIIGHSVRGFMRRNFAERDRNGRDGRGPGGPASRGMDDYRTRNSGSPAESEGSSLTSPDLNRVSQTRTGRESPLRRSFGTRSIEPQGQTIRMIPRSVPEDGTTETPETGDAAKTPSAAATTDKPAQQPRQRPRPPSPLRRKSSGHDSYHGPGEADSYYFGTPAGEQEPGVYYGPPPPKMPTPPPPPAPKPPKYKPGGGSAASFYDPDADPEAAIPIEQGSQYELTIMNSGSGSGAGYPPPQQPTSFFGGPITAEPASTYPSGYPDTPTDAMHHGSFSVGPHSTTTGSFSSAVSNPSYPPIQPSYASPVQTTYTHPANPSYQPPSTNMSAVAATAVAAGAAVSAVDAATAAELAYDQHLANIQRPPSQTAPSVSNLPPLPPSTAPTYASPYAPPSSNSNAQVASASYQPPPPNGASGVSVQSPVLASPQPQHPNAVPALAAAAVAGGIVGAAAYAASSHSHSNSVTSPTTFTHPPPYIPPQQSQQQQQTYSQTSQQTYSQSSQQITSSSSTNSLGQQKPPKPHKPSILAGILSGKKPSNAQPTTSQSGSGVGGKILAGGLVTAAAAVGTALAGQSSGSSSKPYASSSHTSAFIDAAKPSMASSSSSSHHMDGKTAAIVAGSAVVAVAAAASHHKDKQKYKLGHKNSQSSTDSGRIHGLKGKLNYSKKSNDIRGIKLPSAINTFDSASSSDFMFDSDDDSSSSSSSASGRKRRAKKDKGKARGGPDLDMSSSHSSMDFSETNGTSRSIDAIPIPGKVSDLNHSDDEGASPRLRAHMRKKSTDSDLAFGRSLGSASGYTSDSSMYSTGHSPENGNGFQFWAIRNRRGPRKAKRVSSRDSINSVNSALGWGDSSDETNGGSGRKKLRNRDSVDSNLAFGLSSTSTSRRSSYASGLRDKFSISEEDEEHEYDHRTGKRKPTESPSKVKDALADTAAAVAVAEMSRHGRRPSEGIIVAPGHRLITEEQRMADYERLDKMRRQEVERDIARMKEAARLRELEKDRIERERFERERMDRRRKEEEFARERQWLIEEDEKRKKTDSQRQVSPYLYYY